MGSDDHQIDAVFLRGAGKSLLRAARQQKTGRPHAGPARLLQERLERAAGLAACRRGQLIRRAREWESVRRQRSGNPQDVSDEERRAPARRQT